MAREADVKRGWGLFCSKSCKAIKQERRTGQHRKYLSRKIRSYSADRSSEYDPHPFSSEALGQW